MEARSVLTCRQGNYIERQQRFPYFAYVGVALLLCSLAVLLSGCAKVPAKKGTGQVVTPTTTPMQVTPTPTPKPPNITLQVVGCPSGLSINWDRLVGTTPHVNKVQKVTCGTLEGSGTFEALVNVRYYSPDARLDFYVYDNLFGAPTRTFKMLGLLNGDAQISPSSTIMTAEVGPQDALKASPDVFKEYRWNGTTFGQIFFPGMYPDMTYYQAEQDQAQLNAELAAGERRNAWKITFYGVVDNLATKIFHWTDTHTSTIRFRSSTGTYIAAVTNLGPGGGGFIASMFHLDNSEANIFEVMQVTSLDGTASLLSPTTGGQLTSPVKVSGTSLASGSILGKVVVYNDTFIAVGDSGDIRSPISSGYTSFTKAVQYRLNGPGLQEGIVVFTSTTQNNTNLSSQVIMVKVLLSG